MIRVMHEFLPPAQHDICFCFVRPLGYSINVTVPVRDSRLPYDVSHSLTQGLYPLQL